jgi:hypothetical protein
VKKDQDTEKAAKVQQKAVEPWMDGWMDGWMDWARCAIVYVPTGRIKGIYILRYTDTEICPGVVTSMESEHLCKNWNCIVVKHFS